MLVETTWEPQELHGLILVSCLDLQQNDHDRPPSLQQCKIHISERNNVFPVTNH